MHNDIKQRLHDLETEQRNEKTMHIDEMPTVDALRTINDLDHEVTPAVAACIPDIAALVDAAYERMEKGGRLIYMGAGTSGRLGVLDASECPPTYGVDPGLVVGLIAGGPDALIRAFEGVEDSEMAGEEDLEGIGLSPNDTVVGLAASGRTPYVIGGLAYARRVGALTGSVSCVKDASISGLADVPVECVIGPEPVTGSTRMRSGTAQKLILNMISTELMIKAGKVYGNLMVDLQPTNEKLVDRATRIIRSVSGVSENEAGELLEASNRDVKVAICAAVSGREVDECRGVLSDHKGNVAQAIRCLEEG